MSTICKTCLKLTKKTLEGDHRRRSDVFIDFEQVMSAGNLQSLQETLITIFQILQEDRFYR